LHMGQGTMLLLRSFVTLTAFCLLLSAPLVASANRPAKKAAAPTAKFAGAPRSPVNIVKQKRSDHGNWTDRKFAKLKVTVQGPGAARLAGDVAPLASRVKQSFFRVEAFTIHARGPNVASVLDKVRSAAGNE
jgi:hypothetical protein